MVMSNVSASNNVSRSNASDTYANLQDIISPDQHQPVLIARRNLSPIVAPASRGRSNSFTHEVAAAVQAERDNRMDQDSIMSELDDLTIENNGNNVTSNESTSNINSTAISAPATVSVVRVIHFPQLDDNEQSEMDTE